MTEDLQTTTEKAEGYGSWDIDDILLLVGVSITGAVAFAFWLYSKQIASIGVGLIGSFTAPVTAGGNGIASVINSFFQWASTKISALMIQAVLVHSGSFSVARIACIAAGAW